MLRKISLLVAGLASSLISSAASGTTCSAYTYTLTNGTTADANQVMSNFNSILNCANSSLAPLSGPNFSGSVGIGIATPGATLDVQGIALFDNSGSRSAGGGLRVVAPIDSGHVNWMLGAQQNVSSGFEITPSTTAGGTTFTTPVVTFLSSGNVGIGTTNPLQKLSVSLPSPASSAQPATINGAVGDNHTALFLNFSDGASAQLGSKIGIQFGGYQGYGIGGIFGVMTSTSGNTYGDLTFDLKNGASDSTLTERMRITSAGLVGIGTTAPSYSLDVVGDIRTSTCLRYPGGTLGTGCTSDIALKRTVTPFQFGLQAIIGLQPVSFYYNGLGGNPDDGVQQLGLIAQDVEKVAPQLVGSRLIRLRPSDAKPTPVKTVNYSALTYMLINAVKELKASNDRYAAQLAALRIQVTELQRRTNIRTARLSTHSSQ